MDQSNTKRQLINRTYSAMQALVDAIDELRLIQDALIDLQRAGVTMPVTVEDMDALLTETNTNMPALLLLKLLAVSPQAIGLWHQPMQWIGPDGETIIHEGTAMEIMRAIKEWTP